MLVIGAVLTLVLSFLVVIAVVVPKIRKRRKKSQSNLLMLPAPAPVVQRRPERWAKEDFKKNIQNLYTSSGKNFNVFFQKLGVNPRIRAKYNLNDRNQLRNFMLKTYHPDKFDLQNKSNKEITEAQVIVTFVESYLEKPLDITFGD